MFSIVPRAKARTTVTPNATMVTLASPTIGATAGLSLWQVEMKAGQQGPWHTFDVEQLWTVASGSVIVATGEGEVVLHAGDTGILPAGMERQITALAHTRVIVCGAGDAVVHARGEDEPRGTPDWIA
jgi:quercetin dioxygenase-like cupin family protein